MLVAYSIKLHNNEDGKDKKNVECHIHGACECTASSGYYYVILYVLLYVIELYWAQLNHEQNISCNFSFQH